MAEQAKKIALCDMKPENMTPAQRGQAFDEYVQNLIDTDQLGDMMKSKEKVMEIVMKERVLHD